MTRTTTTKNGHGGVRAGAGRPVSGAKTPISLRMEPELLQRAQADAARLRITLTEWLTRATRTKLRVVGG